MRKAATTSGHHHATYLFAILAILTALLVVPAASGEGSKPKSPENLTLAQASDTSLSLKWDAPRPRGGNSIVGYRVYLDGTRPSTTSTATVDVASPATTYEFASLRCGTAYTLAVDSVDDAGAASDVAAITASTSQCTTDTTPPTAPTGLTQTASTESSVTLSWNAATDDSGVAGYSLALDGVDAGTTTETSHTFQGLACEKAYRVEVSAYDATGNRSTTTSVTAATASCPQAAPGPEPEPTAAAALAVAAGSVSFAVAADARVSEESPTANFGGSRYLRVDGGSDPDVQSYLRFDVTGTGGAVAAARLRVYATSHTADGPAVYPTGNGWDERGITWSNRPAPVGQARSDVGFVAPGTWIEFDVTGLVSGDGAHSFVFITDTSDGLDMYARESGTPAQLVLTLGGGGGGDSQPPTVPSSLIATSATSSSVTLAWRPSTDNVGVDGYRVYVDGAHVATTQALTHTVTGLACDTSFTLAVEAFDAAGNVSPRAATSARTGACTTPPPPSPGVSFVGDAETGNASQWCFVHSALPVGVVTSPVRDGRYAYKSEVRDGALIYSTERSEYSNGPNVCDRDKFVAGEETWTAVSVYLPLDFPKYSHWSLVTQFKEPFGGTPPQQINLQNDQWSIVGAASISPRPRWVLGGVRRGAWTDFLVHHKWSPDRSVGFVEVYVNGALALPKTFTRTMENTNPLFLSVGYYRDTSATTGPATLYVDAVRVGTTRDAVAIG
jgi:chitodextrinase